MKANILSLFFILLISTSAHAWPWDKKVKFKDESGKVVLTYNCNDFMHQVKTREDIKVLTRYIVIVRDDATTKQDVITLTSLAAGLSPLNIRLLEEEVVNYMCKEYGK